MQAIAVEVHQAGQRHHRMGIGIAQVHQGVIAFHHTVAHVHHISQQGTLQVGLIAAVQGTAAVVDIVPRVLPAPLPMELLRGEDVVERHDA